MLDDRVLRFCTHMHTPMHSTTSSDGFAPIKSAVRDFIRKYTGVAQRHVFWKYEGRL